MKYLKLFEDHEDKLFWPISHGTYSKIVYGTDFHHMLIRKYIIDNWQIFSNEEIKKIERYIGSDIIKSESYDHKLSTFIYYSTSNSLRIDMVKMSDEWYYISTISLVNSNPVSYNWFQCDQWDGFIACLEYLKKIDR